MSFKAVKLLGIRKVSTFWLLTPTRGFEVGELLQKASLVAQMVQKKKKSTCNAGDLGSLPSWEDPLEEDMATHSSILAWETAWAEEPGGLQSMGSQRVRHD